MSSTAILTIMFVGLIVIMATGLPIAFVLGGFSLFLTLTLWNPDSVVILVLQIFDTMMSEPFLAVPLFILMAAILQRSGVIEDLYRVMELWFGRLRGGLAIGTVIICVLMAAMTGVVGAAVTTMGVLAMPEMLRRKYDASLVAGTICAAGTLGVLIPPSVLTIVYAVVAQVSIGKMLIAGIIPGALLATIYILYILYVAYFKTGRVPLGAAEPVPVSLKILSLRAVIIPFFLIVVVLGAIFFGITTPTEAAAVGVVGAVVASAIRRRLHWRGLAEASIETLKATSMILWITMGAKAYVAIFTGLGGANALISLIQNLHVSPYMVLAIMMVILIFLGTCLDEIGIILLTVPVFLPITRALGFDDIWFGVLFAITIQIGYISPPFGYSLFYIKATLPKEMGMGVVYRGVFPFMGMQLLALVLCVLYPPMVTWLPSLMN